MLLSIVIISWNSRHYLQPCVESLLPLLERGDVELIWVDNGSTDGSAEMMNRVCPDAVTTLLGENRGVAGARNVGLRRASGRYILLLDDDTLSTPSAILSLVEYMEKNPGVGICAPSLRGVDGTLQDSFKPYPGLRSKISNVVNHLIGRRRSVSLPSEVIYPCYVIGACQMIRHSVIDSVGLLDDHIFYGPEDADLCIRARQAGYTVAYLPNISISHLWRRVTVRKLLSPMSWRHIKGLIHLYRKHRRWI